MEEAQQPASKPQITTCLGLSLWGPSLLVLLLLLLPIVVTKKNKKKIENGPSTAVALKIKKSLQSLKLCNILFTPIL